MDNALTELMNDLEMEQDCLKEIQSEMADFSKDEYITEDMYDDMLDDVYGEVDVCGMKYLTSMVLKELDPTAYRCGMLDYADDLSNEDFEEWRELEERETEILNCIAKIEQEIEELEQE